MMKAYYSKPQPTVEKPPTVVPLPTIKEGDDLDFKSSLFQNARGDLITVRPSDALIRHPCVAVGIGKAYDGLPLVLNISRERRIKGNVLSLLGVECEADLHPSICKPLLELEEAVQSRACATGLVKTDKLGDSVTQYYKTHSDVGCLIKNTLLAQLLKDTSTSSLNERGEGYKDAFMDKKTTMHVGVPLLSGGEGQVLKPSKPLSVKTRLTSDDIPEDERGAVMLEPLFLECLLGVLPSTVFQCLQDWSVGGTDPYSHRGSGREPSSTTPKAFEGLLTDRKSYLHALSLGRSVSFFIDRHELLARVLAPLARDVYETMHCKGRVHGDIKPANVLLVEGAPKLIDARGCSIGGVSSTYTPSWCAPEQTLGKPLDASADVYALAMMLMQILGGQIYGEVKNFKMPSATGGSSATIQVLDTEGVWLESGIGLAEEARNVWREALARFLSFHPAKRPTDGKAFAEELEKLLNSHPVKGMKPLKMDGAMGSARLKRVKGEGAIGKEEISVFPTSGAVPAWVLEDSYPNVV